MCYIVLWMKNYIKKLYFIHVKQKGALTKSSSVQPKTEKFFSVIIIIFINWSYCELF